LRVWEEILEDMRAGVSWSEICEKYRSRSQIYEALRIFLKESSGRYQKVQNDLVREQKKLEDTKTQHHGKIGAVKKLSGEISDLREEKEQLLKKVGDLKMEVIEFESRVSDLEERGFTKEIVKIIVDIEDMSGEQLLMKIKNAKKYYTMVKDCSRLKKKKRLLDKEITTEEKSLQDIKAETRRLLQDLHDLKVRICTYSDAVEVTEKLLNDGYSVDDIESLRYGLKSCFEEGEHCLSVKSLVERLLATKSLEDMDREVSSTKNELVTLKLDLQRLRKKREVIEKGAIRRIHEVGVWTQKDIWECGIAAKKAIEELIKSCEAVLVKQEDSLSHFVQRLKRDFDQHGKLQQKIGTLGTNVFLGQAFWGLMNSDDYLAKLDSKTISGVVDRITCWVRIHCKEKVPLQPQIAQKLGLIPYFPYDIADFSMVLADAIRSKSKNLSESDS
jgi:hypothetical protein